MPEKVIEAINVVKYFDGRSVKALDGINLQILRSEFVAITGASGCGKSTLLHLLAGLDHPSSGVVRVNGRDLSQHEDLNAFRKFEVGLVFQLHNLLPGLTALQNIEVAMIGNGSNHGAQRDRAKEVLEAVGLEKKARFAPPRLSGGERQRLAIARALANRPSILLADEPTGNLDSSSVRLVLDLLAQIRISEQITIVLVTHDPEVASAADRGVRMRDGRVVTEAEEGEMQYATR